MKNSKKNIISITMIALMIFLTGCMFADKNEPEEVDFHTSKRSEESDYCKEILDEIVRCFNEDDKETLKNLFSEYKKSEYNFDNMIREAMEAYEGISTSCDVYAYETVATHVQNGYYSKKVASVEYRNVIMDSGAEYFIKVTISLVNDENPEGIGVSGIVIRDANDIDKVIAKIGQ